MVQAGSVEGELQRTIESHELRQNNATREWVIYSRVRKNRPRDFSKDRSRPAELPPFDRSCPFCTGNEDLLTPVVWERKSATGPGWLIRVVPNKFPALTTAGSNRRGRHGIYLTMEGHGMHEVVIENPLHNRQLPDMALDEVVALIETYQYRYKALMDNPDNMMVVIFRNHGPLAGTSLVHPHSQIIAMGIVPAHIRSREEEAQRYFDEQGTCVYCDILAFEERDRQRVVFENASYLAFVPFAAGSPFEIWILPKRHAADFGSATSGELRHLAAALQECLGRLSRKLGDPDYNYVINTAARFRGGEPQLHWYLQIRPRITTPAGFEIGSGVSINPSLPEEDAALLNE
jgi:UDPglucose--hexose-1-phosphate uridylyltransferase